MIWAGNSSAVRLRGHCDGDLHGALTVLNRSIYKMAKRAVVFGASGQLGVELCGELRRRGYEIAALRA